MAIPIPETNQWLKLVEDVLPWATIFGISFKAIDAVFKYFSNGQDSRLREIIKPDIALLTKAIDELRESIWELKADKK